MVLFLIPSTMDVVLNHDYEGLGNYYNIAMVSAMPHISKGNPSVEGTVVKVTN